VSGLLLALYTLSGVGALAVETIWMRWLRLLLGATAPAASATLVAFFAGSALGAAVAGRRSVRWRRPLAVYGGLELAGAVAAAAVPLALRAGDLAVVPLYDGLREMPWALALFRFGLALAATVPAAFCFGATFPAIGAAAIGPAARLGARGSALYAANTLGAALGTALAVFALPGRIGVRATYALALAALATAGLGALLLSRISRAAPRDEGLARERTSPPGQLSPPDARLSPAASEASRSLGVSPQALAKRARLARRSRAKFIETGDPSATARHSSATALAALAGFCGFALQVLLVQAFAQVLNQSVYAFGAVLICVLLAIALAAGAVALLEARGWLEPRSAIGVALVAAALATAAFPAWLERTTAGFRYVGSETPGLGYLAAAMASVALAAGPALLAGSFVLPLVFALAARGGGRLGAGPLLGRLAAANTAGAIAGALAAPYLLIPGLGLWPAFLGVALPWTLAAALVPARSHARRGLLVGVLAAGWIALLLGASPLAVPPVRLERGESLLDVESTPAGVVAVVRRDGERLIRIDGHYALGGTAERAHHERQAALPLLLAPRARRVAHVGSATGISAGAALLHPIESLELVEIVPGVARAAARHFDDANRGVYRDPRTRVVLDDARNFLRSTSERFDVVIGDLFVPWHAGAGALYTREHFEAVRAHLAPGGLFCQWLPLYQLSLAELRVIAATFLDVFPGAAVFRGDFYGRFPIIALVGWNGQPASAADVEAAARRLAQAGVRDRWVADPDGVWALYVGPLAALADWLADAPRNSDDRPWIERLAAAGHVGGERGKLEPATGLAWIDFAEQLRTAAARSGDPIYPDLSERGRSDAEGGAELQRAGALFAAGRVDAAAQHFERAAQLLPARLVADAPEDATAAEVWR
jgi:spermidine synthase